MVTFASGLALPFFLLALFPSYLKRLPRSGGWMARVKVVLGFVILAASLKYLAGLDQVFELGVLPRERFLAAWIVLFGMAGLYLLGFVRLEGIKPDEPMGVARLLTGIGFLTFAISLAPGMFGGRLGDLEAYIPAAAGGAGTSGASESGVVWMKDRYREALARARREGKLVFVSFTGYFCANCHWMKANMFPRPEIVSAMQGFVPVELYADGTDAASEENAKLELSKFQTVSQPFYAILDPDEKVIATFDRVTRDPAEFVAFLRKGGAPAGSAPTQAASAPTPPGSASAPAASNTPAAAPVVPAVKTLDGADLDTQKFSGKVVVLNFWATWCVPCIQEIPSFNKLHRDLASKGVAVLGISMDEEGAERVRPFLTKHPMEYIVALGPEPLNATYRLDQLPVTLVFDRSGKQVERFEGFTPEDKLRAAVEKAL
jgi:thiol:disulfide interchange protein DsbD